ncbi:PREDICTED: eukaryotic translation initiation factor 2D isoform X1 [Nanorana parkeri]|uniref:eukaryotic translation initiation factor 2D isoform X1 n=1 Tax=Nanorana parkeri TaxID=125878 RepID=UPI00085449A0|nr:PREDICTED: eukaryotic translation initiation factor 2D isoform X1 [Nanorana parkeri]
MFCKPFRVKSHTALKSSDRKKLRGAISSAFSSLTTENLADLMPSKEDLTVVKVFVHKGDAVSVYVHNKNPIIFELERRFYPTVYTLWRHPDILPVFSTWPPVFERMNGGADLMLPGVLVSSGLPEVQKGTLCAITLVGNRAPVAIGVATMSTKDMLASGMKGKGFNILHTYKDQLWAYGDESCPPNISSEEIDVTASAKLEEEIMSLDSESQAPSTELENLHLQEVAATVQQKGGEIKENTETLEEEREGMPSMENCNTSSQETMDDLLHQCFFHALKYKVKKSDLPLLTSAFLRNYLFACCPEGQQVDIKKSSYKKLSKFLQVMQQRNILQVKELSKGVESIVEIQWKHPDVISFVAPTTVLPLETCETSDGGRKQSYQPPEISSLYGINAKMLPLFQASGHRKGDLLTHNEVRSVTITYVKTNELVHSDKKNFVIVDPVICDCLLNASEKHDLSLLKWDDLLTRCLERMQPSHRVTFPGISSVVRKGNIEPIDIAVAQRGSNKKVTIIKNLELYGLDPLSVGSALQQRVQASFSCTVLPGTKDRVQVQIQGNQVSQAGKLLLDYFKIPRKYISGLDLAVKAGKKK